MKFIPDELEEQSQIPYLDEARAEDGWKGQGSKQSIEQLRSKIAAEIGRLGGTVTGFLRGEFEIDKQRRVGVAIRYQIVGPAGRAFEGRIDVAGLPIREPYDGNRSHSDYKRALADRKEHALRMALYNVHNALQSTRILQVLSPGYAALIPWLLVDGDETLGQKWLQGPAALPAPDDGGELVDAHFREIE